MNYLPRTAAIIAAADACQETRIVFLIKSLANLANELEGELAEAEQEKDIQSITIQRLQLALAEVGTPLKTEAD